MPAKKTRELKLSELSRAAEKLGISEDRLLRVQYEQRMKAERDAIAWQRDPYTVGIREGKQQGLDEGKQQGLDEGKQQGLDEGKQQGRQEAVLELLALRGLEVSDSVRAKVLACTDPAMMSRYLARAATAGSAEEIFGTWP